MRTQIVAAAGGGHSVPVNELRDLFVCLLDAREVGGDEKLWRQRLPRWLTEKFAVEMTAEQRQSWLVRWRSAPPAQRASMERGQGWNLPQWLYWFTAENDLWVLSQIDVTDRRLVISVDHEDDPFPMKVLEWSFSVAGFRIESVRRIV